MLRCTIAPPILNATDSKRAMRFLDRTLERLGLVAAPPPWPPRRLSLALQGGGSFGAFTWGALERLLDEPEISFDAISGVSAGAVNAVLLASGLMEGGRDGGQGAAGAVLEADEPRGGADAERRARRPVARADDPRAVALSVQPVQPQPAARGAERRGRLRAPADALAGAPADRRDAGQRRRAARVLDRRSQRRRRARLRLPAADPSCDRDRRRALLGRRLFRQSAAHSARARLEGRRIC